MSENNRVLTGLLYANAAGVFLGWSLSEHGDPLPLVAGMVLTALALASDPKVRAVVTNE